MQFTKISPSLALLGFTLTLTLAACDDAEAPAQGELSSVFADDDILDFDPSTAKANEPDFVLQLAGGSTLSFVVDDEGGVAMLEEVPGDGGVAAVLDDPWLEDASPAVVWYSLTGEGDEIPQALRDHHEGLAAIGELAPLAEALADRPRSLAPIVLADSDSPCLNSTFNTNHCDHPDYADSACLFNTTGGAQWNTNGAYRYKAGFCLQEGTARSWLSYADEAGGCTFWNSLTFAWGMDSALFGTSYPTGTYRSYVWWSSANGGRRNYTHVAIPNAGAVYDFGNRFTTAGCTP